MLRATFSERFTLFEKGCKLKASKIGTFSAQMRSDEATKELLNRLIP